jgi:hypothetical protein
MTIRPTRHIENVIVRYRHLIIVLAYSIVVWVFYLFIIETPEMLTFALSSNLGVSIGLLAKRVYIYNTGQSRHNITEIILVALVSLILAAVSAYQPHIHMAGEYWIILLIFTLFFAIL